MFARIVTSLIALAFAASVAAQSKINLGTQAVAGPNLGTGLIVGHGSSALTAYTGSACTNQFLRSLNASGVGTCNTVGSSDLAASLVLVTPNIGVATATSVNKYTLTAPATGATITIVDGKTLTYNNSITIAGTDGTTMTFPATSASIARTDKENTFLNGSGTGNIFQSTDAATLALTITGNSTGRIANINSTGANGGNFAVQNSGTDNGFIGSDKWLASGTLGNFGIQAVGTLKLYGGGSTTLGLAMTSTNTAITTSFSLNAPVTAPCTAHAYTVASTDNNIIANDSATCTFTFPAASGATGRVVTVKTVAAFTVVSASSNVVPLVGGGAGTAILAAVAGKWAKLVSDGTNWVIMEGN